MRKSVFIDAATAYGGEMGQLRKYFCVGFIAQKKGSLQRIEDEIFTQVARRGETITCRKGCPVCCVAYIEANIQECEAIAFYLYESPVLLDSFITRYQKWRRRMRRINSSFARCEAILHRVPGYQITGEDQAVLLGVLKNYQQQAIPCSFLEGGACTIHEVRPYVCANHFVTTPAAWCRVANRDGPVSPNRAEIYMTNIDELYDTTFYVRQLEKPVVGFMPAMVYRILTEGTGYIEKLT